MTKPMTREELEAEVYKIHDYDMSLYDMWKAVYLGIRYGFEKGQEVGQFALVDNGKFLPFKYESAEQVLEELDKEQDDKR